MILYNLTIKVEWSRQNDLLAFLKAHLSEHPGSELFTLEGVDNSDGPTYCMHIKFNELGTYNLHMSVNDAKMKQELQRAFGDKVVYFGSILQTV